MIQPTPNLSHERSYTFNPELAGQESIGIIPQQAAATMSGIEILRAVRDGGLPRPPISALLGFAMSVVEEGRVVFVSEPTLQHYNPLGSVHGGFIATLLDSAMGCAVHSLLNAGVHYTTVELKVNYLRALTETSGPIEAEGTVIHKGRTIATADGRLTDVEGRLYAHATTTCLIMHPQAR
jgi:uncharacterized protein (TIGR00369 family)